MGKRGYPSAMSLAMLPRRAGYRKQVQFERNSRKTMDTWKAYRAGFRLWWRACPDYLLRIGVRGVGEYDPKNQTGGVMFTLPGDIELTERQAGQILWKSYQSRDPHLTQPQLRQVKKTLSFAKQVQGGGPKSQFAQVKATWDACFVENMATSSTSTAAAPGRTPIPAELRTVFGVNWDPNCGQCLIEWSVAQLAAFDWCVNGARPNVDLGRLKWSEVHDFDLAEGWCNTAFKDGRAKLENKKRNTRPWKSWRPCLCSGKRHIPVPEDIEYESWKHGNPTSDITWCTGCPVSALELVLRLQKRLYPEDQSGKRGRIYRGWSHSRRCFHKENLGSPVGTALNWLRLMGLTRDFDTNAGRKSLARWTLKLNVPYAA